MRLLLHLAGNHPDLPQADLEATLAACGLQWTPQQQDGRVLEGHLQQRPDRPSTELAPWLNRLALTREASFLLFKSPREADALLQAARAHPLVSTGPDSPTRFMVRAEYTHPGSRGDGPGRAETERLLGQAWQGLGQVDLKDPTQVIRAWITRDEIWVGRRVWVNDPTGYRRRAPKQRPYFSPVSGEPVLMRAVANLARVPPGGLVYDPLVGTGGLLLEAGLAGMHVAGSDVDPTMVQGTRENLTRYEVEPFALFLSDVRDAVERFLLATGRTHADAVVTDLPYGQSSPTGGAAPIQIAQWTLQSAARLLPAGHRLVIGTPEPQWLEPAPALGFFEEQHFDVRVHKSLTRSYHVLQRVLDKRSAGAVL